jgi:hypothetical protein
LDHCETEEVDSQSGENVWIWVSDEAWKSVLSKAEDKAMMRHSGTPEKASLITVTAKCYLRSAWINSSTLLIKPCFWWPPLQKGASAGARTASLRLLAEIPHQRPLLDLLPG